MIRPIIIGGDKIMKSVLNQTLKPSISENHPTMLLPHAFNYIIAEELAAQRNIINEKKVAKIKNRINQGYNSSAVVSKILKGVL